MDCHFLLKKKMKFVTVWFIRLFLFMDTHSSWRKCHCVSIAVVIIQVFRQYLVKLRWNCNLKIWSVKFTLWGGRIFGSPSYFQMHILVYVCAKVSCFLLELHNIFSPFHWATTSLVSKFNKLKVILQGIFDILIIHETKLNASFPAAQFWINGFSTPYRLDRNWNVGGTFYHLCTRRY